MTVPDFAARPQLAEDVARLIRRRIFDGTYPAGKYIRLDQLAAELGISVTPVREALFGLRTEGLLAQQPRRGFIVLPVTRRDIDDVAGVQAHIGGQLAARAAGQITDAQLEELGRIQDELEQAYARDDHEAAVRLNHAFHRGVNRAAESPKLAQLMSRSPATHWNRCIRRWRAGPNSPRTTTAGSSMRSADTTVNSRAPPWPITCVRPPNP